MSGEGARTALRGEPIGPGGRRLRTLLAAAVAAAGALLFAVPPEAIDYTCPFRALTGYDCFSCGLTRSLHAAARGDLLASLMFHPAGMLIALGALALAGVWLAEALTGRRAGLWRPWGRRALAALVAAWLLFGAGRLLMQAFR